MTQIVIVNPVQTDFTMLPNIVWRWPGLSFRARAFMAYLLSFHGGVCPPVAAMERETGIGRDARRACMAELQAAGLAAWVVERDGAGRVVAKFLEVTTLPLIAAQVREAEQRAAEVAEARAQAAGQGPRRHAPEKPSDGFSGGSRRNVRRSCPESQAILKKDEDKDGKALTSQILKPEPAAASGVKLADLSAFARSCLAAGKAVPLGDGRSLAVGAAGYRALEAEAQRQRHAGDTAMTPGAMMVGRSSRDGERACGASIRKGLDGSRNVSYVGAGAGLWPDPEVRSEASAS